MSFHNGELLRRQAMQVATPPPSPVAEAPQPAPSITEAVTAHAPSHPSFDAVAQRVAQAEADAATAATALQDAQVKLAQVDRRITDIDAKRAEVIARRAGGERMNSDGAMLAVLDADREGLTAIRTGLATALAEAQSQHDAAVHRLDVAQQYLRLAENRETLARLATHATELANLLLESVRRIAALEDRLNISSAATWAPPTPLVEALRRQAFAARSAW